MIVCKFGGSSVASKEQFEKVKRIVEANANRKFIVVSACGKENCDDYKVTDLLYLLHAHINYGVSYETIFSLVKEKYQRICGSLALKIDLEKEFASIKEMLDTHAPVDYIVSRGEYLTARCMAEYLGAKFLDAKDVIAFKYNGDFDFEKIKQNLDRLVDMNRKYVIPGFYGALPNGQIKVMSRGGSDITGSILANITDAEVYENWTDVSGILVADPRIIDNPQQIPVITYSELRGMSYMGANVLHDDAIFPVREKNIPIHILNTNEPDNPGTFIQDDCQEYDKANGTSTVTGITGRRDYASFTVVKSHSSTEVGFLRRLLFIFEEYHISIESVPITVDTFTVIVQKGAIEQCKYEILAKIKKELEPDELMLEEDLAMVAIVGRGMKQVPGASGQLLSEFGNHKINIKVINQSADELSVVVGVSNHDFHNAIRCIYERFIQEEREHA